MMRPGQYSLSYFFVEGFWIVLAVYFGHNFYLSAIDLQSQYAWSPILTFIPAMLFMSVSVGGLFNFQGMRLGAGVGAVCIAMLGLAIAAENAPSTSIDRVLWLLALTEALVGLAIIGLAVVYRSHPRSIWWLLGGAILVGSGMLARNMLVGS